MFANTPVDTITFAGREIFVKRDDLLHPAFSGNKARKFAYFLEHEFVGISKVIGHGSAQANSLYSLSALAQLKGWQCDFYVDHIATYLRDHPRGNYAAALANGANVIDVSQLLTTNALAPMSCLQYIEQQVLPHEPLGMFIPEGGRCAYAKYGVDKLGKEILAWARANNMSNLKVFLPSGTGTTALFLNQ
ncbi:MAG: 1-aminocyclopropane-1-carboxylate deaminase/D-cysteine desulfhydrase, partial [Shewanella sp.]